MPRQDTYQFREVQVFALTGEDKKVPGLKEYRKMVVATCKELQKASIDTVALMVKQDWPQKDIDYMKKTDDSYLETYCENAEQVATLMISNHVLAREALEPRNFMYKYTSKTMKMGKNPYSPPRAMNAMKAMKKPNVKPTMKAMKAMKKPNVKTTMKAMKAMKKPNMKTTMKAMKTMKKPNTKTTMKAMQGKKTITGIPIHDMDV